MNLTIENEIRTVASKSKEATYQKNVLMLQTYADLSGESSGNSSPRARSLQCEAQTLQFNYHFHLNLNHPKIGYRILK